MISCVGAGIVLAGTQIEIVMEPLRADTLVVSTARVVAYVTAGLSTLSTIGLVLVFGLATWMLLRWIDVEVGFRDCVLPLSIVFWLLAAHSVLSTLFLWWFAATSSDTLSIATWDAQQDSFQFTTTYQAIQLTRYFVLFVSLLAVTRELKHRSAGTWLDAVVGVLGGTAAVTGILTLLHIVNTKIAL